MQEKYGFKNINVDLIIGIPNQTMEMIENELDEIIKINPEHVSIYSLIVEDNTVLKKQIEDGEYTLLQDDLERQMYWRVNERLSNSGYSQYEISNYSKPMHESKHNLDCWNQKEYIGFGVSAHSYTNNVRYSNIDSIEEYINNFRIGKEVDNLIFHEKQNLKSKMDEYMMLGLRKIDGVSKEEFKNKFDLDIMDLYKESLKKLQEQGLIIIDENIKLSKRGIDLANIVWEEFV